MPATLGRYELIAEIGRGGMADVELAIQRGPSGFEKLVVLKLIKQELQTDTQVVRMLLDEGKLSALIKHPNVVEIYELGEADGRNFIAMEYLEGEPLLAVLDKGYAGKKLDALSMARIIADTAEGLDAAHVLKGRDGKPLGIVHHDVSLGNIFVLYSGQVKLLDFGVAKAARSVAKKQEQAFGKLVYMAPEKLDDRPGDRRSDIWSLGCVLWEALAFKRLFKGANETEIIREVRYINVPAPSTVNKDVPVEFDPIVLKMLQRDPARRYQTAKDVALAIEDVLTAKQYPSKNYKIGAYMMQAFAERIAAREKLLREVAGANRPSAEVIDAAFGDALEKRESAPMLDEPIPDLMSTTSSVMEIEGAAPPPSAAVQVENPFAAEDEQAETVYDVVPANAEASRALRYEADPSWNRGKHGQALKELQRKTQEQRDDPDGTSRRFIPYAIGGAIALVVLIVIAKSCGGSSSKKPAPSPIAAIVIDAPPIDAVEVDAAIEAGIDAMPIDAAVVEEIEMPAETKPVDKPDKPVRPKPTKSAEQLYADGLTAWKKNDYTKAYALFTDGRRANAKYPNNWYGIGLVHEKLGRKKEAKVAYERYLTLVPNAPNAGKLRDHIKKSL